MKDAPRNVPCPVRTAATSTPNSPAVIGHFGEASFAELDRRVSAAADILESLGFPDGAKLGAYLPKDIRQFVLVLAAIRAGMVFVPISARIPPERIPPLLERAGCAALISDNEEALRAAGNSGVRTVRPEEILGDEGEGGASPGGASSEKGMPAEGASGEASSGKSSSGKSSSGEGTSDEAAFVEGSSVESSSVESSFSEASFSEASFSESSFVESLSGELRIPLGRSATVVFTSGSSGVPKAAMHTFGNHYFSALGSNENIVLSPGDVWLHSLPLYHVGGLSILFRCLLAGAAMALPNPNAPVGRSIVESGATHVSLVAAQLRRMLDEDVDLSRVKAILLGGSAMPESLVIEARRRGLPIHTSYGLTETSSQATTTRPGASLEELRTSGEPLPYREVSVAEDGEVLARGETLFAGYVEGGGLFRPFDDDGWFHTKDLGRMGEGGRLSIVGRKNNLFISGGENIQPEEVEESLRRAPTVEDAVVVPVADEEFGFRPVAFVKGEFSPEDLRSFLERSLPRFAVPVSFHPWPDDVPGGMKVNREFFRERAGNMSRGR